MMKIPLVPIIRQYELTFLVPGDLTEAEATKVKDEVTALIKKHQGKVLEQEDWGKRLLAYKIKKATKVYQEAYYVHLLVEFKAAKVQTFEKDLHLKQSVIRHLLVVQEGKPEVAPKQEVKKPVEEAEKSK